MTDQELKLELLKLAVARKASSIADGRTVGWSCLDAAKKWYDWTCPKDQQGVCGSAPKQFFSLEEIKAYAQGYFDHASGQPYNQTYNLK